MTEPLPAVQDLFVSSDGRLRSGWRFFLGFVCVVAAYFLAILAASILAAGHPKPFELCFRSLWAFFELFAFIFLSSALDRPGTSLWQYNGLPRDGWLRDSAIGALLGFVMIGIAVTFMAAAFRLTVASLRFNPHTILLSVGVFVVILAGAMAEELAFRGYPFQRLVEGGGPILAILVLSALFAAIHLGNPHISDNRFVRIFAFVNTLYIGAVLAIAYLRTRALWLPWGIHFGWNATLGLFFGLPVSGINDFSVVVRSRAIGPEWLLGGAYGIEGGFLGTAVITLGLLYVVQFVPKKELAALPQPPAPELLPESIQSDIGNQADL